MNKIDMVVVNDILKYLSNTFTLGECTLLGFKQGKKELTVILGSEHGMEITFKINDEFLIESLLHGTISQEEE